MYIGGRSSFDHSSFQREEESRKPSAVLVVFLLFQFLGLSGIVLVLTTALCSKRLFRFSTWISFCVSWIVSCISYTLLTFAGQQTGPPPDLHLCQVQAAMVYGAPVLTACTTLALVLQLYDNLCNLLAQETVRRVQWKTVCFLVVPYAAYAATLVGAFCIAVMRPEHVERLPSSLYCHVDTEMPGKVTGSVAAAVVVAALVIQAMIGVKMYRNWYALKGIDAKTQRSISVTIRAMFFSVACAIVVGVAVSFAIQKNTPIPNLFMAFLPFAAFLVFGLQSDMIRVWMFWKPPSAPLLAFAKKAQYVDLG